MKNMIKVLVVALTTLSFSALGFAQTKPATPATPATPAAPAEKKNGDEIREGEDPSGYR